MKNQKGIIYLGGRRGGIGGRSCLGGSGGLGFGGRGGNMNLESSCFSIDSYMGLEVLGTVSIERMESADR